MVPSAQLLGIKFDLMTGPDIVCILNYFIFYVFVVLMCTKRYPSYNTCCLTQKYNFFHIILVLCILEEFTYTASIRFALQLTPNFILYPIAYSASPLSPPLLSVCGRARACVHTRGGGGDASGRACEWGAGGWACVQVCLSTHNISKRGIAIIVCAYAYI